VIACHAHPDALDALAHAAPLVARVAPDELLLLGRPAAAAEIEPAAAADLRKADPHALVVDQSDGWTCWTLAGDSAGEAFARLSAVPLPAERPRFVQGAVAGLQSKVFAGRGRIDVLVVSTAGHFLRERILAACRDLKPVELAPAEVRPLGAAPAPDVETP
jgi:hypothetical protein